MFTRPFQEVSYEVWIVARGEISDHFGGCPISCVIPYPMTPPPHPISPHLLASPPPQVSVDTVSAKRYDVSDIDESEGGHPWKLKSKYAMVFTEEELASFDTHFFNIQGKVAKNMHIQQLGVLQVTPLASLATLLPLLLAMLPLSSFPIRLPHVPAANPSARVSHPLLSPTPPFPSLYASFPPLALPPPAFPSPCPCPNALLPLLCLCSRCLRAWRTRVSRCTRSTAHARGSSWLPTRPSCPPLMPPMSHS